MIAWFLFFVLLALSLRCFGWGLLKPERLYQFPTLYGAAWLFYMIPQALGVLNNPGKFPEGVLLDGGPELALLMCIFSVQAGWSGYFSKRLHKKVALNKQKYTHYSDIRILQTGIVLYFIGFYAAYLLASLTGGFIEQFTRGGHYQLEWTGLPVRYVFFAQMIYPGLLFSCLAYLYRPNLIRAGIFFLFSLYPIATSVFLGRRSMTVYLLIIIFFSLFFMRRWTPPRPVVFAGFFAMAIFIVIAPQYRTIMQYGADMEQLREIQIQTEIEEIISGESYAEFDALVVASAAINKEKIFGLGVGFYNAIIAQLVPRQLVGEEFKNALKINLWEEKVDPVKLYSWQIPYGSNPTGVANAFSEFWFFGAFIYFFIAVAIRKLWESALFKGNFSAQIWYVMISLLIPVTVVGSLYIIPGNLLVAYCFVTPMLLYARVSRKYRT